MLKFSYDEICEEIDLEGWSGELIGSLDIKDAEDLLDNLDDVIREAREALSKYVQVRFYIKDADNLSGNSYTYLDPSGSLVVGDIVEVPTYHGLPTKAEVVELGRGAWTGPVKAVTARICRVEL